MRLNPLLLSISLCLLLPSTACALSGRIARVTIQSPALARNLIGDPGTRPADIYLPPGYDDNPAKRYPVIYYLHGGGPFEGSMNWYIGKMDELMTSGQVENTIVVAPSGKGPTIEGNATTPQYTNSAVYGHFEDYIVQDVVGYVEAHYRTIAHRDARALMGHSIGGYGSLKIAVKHPDVFCAVASHSPVRLSFEYEKPSFVSRVMRGGWYELCWLRIFSPNPNNPPDYADRLIDRSGAVVDSVWQRWMQHDPVTLVRQNASKVATLRGIYLDCGDQDEAGAFPHFQIMHETLVELGITHVYEPYRGGHVDKFVEERVPRAMMFLSGVLCPPASQE